MARDSTDWGVIKGRTGTYTPALLIAIGGAAACVALIAYVLTTSPKLWRPTPIRSRARRGLTPLTLPLRKEHRCAQ